MHLQELFALQKLNRQEERGSAQVHKQSTIQRMTEYFKLHVIYSSIYEWTILPK